MLPPLFHLQVLYLQPTLQSNLDYLVLYTLHASTITLQCRQ